MIMSHEISGPILESLNTKALELSLDFEVSLHLSHSHSVGGSSFNTHFNFEGVSYHRWSERAVDGRGSSSNLLSAIVFLEFREFPKPLPLSELPSLLT